MAHIVHIIPTSSDKQDIERSLRDGLLLVKEHNIRSISLPPIGTGWSGLSASDSASIIFQSLNNVWGSSTSFPKVRIVVRQRQFISAFQIEKQKYRKPLRIQTETKGNTKMRDINIQVLHDDLINEKTDVIVNIINADMDLKNAGELSKAIARVCGPQVIQECEKLGQQPGGSPVITSGGNLNVRHIIHLIPKSSDVNHLQMCLENCLCLAESRKLHSISLPAIGTGGYCMLPAISAKLIFQALTNFSRSCVNIKNVRIVIKQEPMVKAFLEEQKRHGDTRNDAASTKPASQTVRISIIGKSQESVDVAINDLERDISDNCTSDEVMDKLVCNFSESQLNMLLTEAEDVGVEMTVDAAVGCVTLLGYKEDVFSISKRVNEELSEVRRREEEEQEKENATLISKTIEWTYELNGEKRPFDLKANFKIEKAYGTLDEEVKVNSSGETFVIDLRSENFIGYRQPQNEEIPVQRKRKGADGEHLKMFTPVALVL